MIRYAFTKHPDGSTSIKIGRKTTYLRTGGEADVRPISGHKTLAQTRTYNKATAEKGRRIALKRREHIQALGERDDKETKS